MSDSQMSTAGPTPRSPERAGSIVDPSSNVLLVLDAAIARQDDLRNQESRRMEDLHKAELNRVDSLREAEMRRRNDLNESEFRRVDDMAKMRAEYQEMLSIAEAKRIDAIRSVDVNAVGVASERATQQAQVLANQVAASADALRALVATTATTFAQQQQSLQTQITERLALLERSQYESKGKESYADPALAILVDQVKRMSDAQQASAGKGQGIGAAWAVGVAAVALVLSFTGSSIFKGAPPAANGGGAPQVIYLPAPAPAVAPAQPAAAAPVAVPAR